MGLMSFKTVKSLVNDILSATTDYNLVYSVVNIEDIADELMEYEDLTDNVIETAINKQLLGLGCTYDANLCFWNAPEIKTNVIKVLITEQLQRVVEIELEDDMSPEEAIDIVRKEYENEEIVLDSSDYSDTTYSIYEE